jgi:flavin reductase (DIM6/NTAB) family NADH-FMN oxidoreductase RutF
MSDGVELATDCREAGFIIAKSSATTATTAATAATRAATLNSAASGGHYYLDLEGNEFGSERSQAIHLAGCKASLDCSVLKRFQKQLIREEMPGNVLAVARIVAATRRNTI